MTDHILLRVGTRADGTWRYGPEKVLLAPGEDWNKGLTPYDNRRACDPSVVRGEFLFRRGDRNVAERFTWLMCYTALGKRLDEGGVHQVALAVANTPEGPWYKAGIIVPSPSAGIWGVGIPSLFSMDGKARVQILYSHLDSVEIGHCMVCEVDLSDVNNPRLIEEFQITSTGLTTTFGTPDVNPTGGDFVLDPQTETVWLIRPENPRAETIPELPTAVQLASIPRGRLAAADGEWTVHADFHAVDFGFLRFFLPGFIRDDSGHVPTGQELSALVSTTEVEGQQYLWSYRVHELQVSAALDDEAE